MSEEMNLSEELREMERALCSLVPAPPESVDRDKVIFEAGCAAAIRHAGAQARLWQGLCGVLAAGCAMLWLIPHQNRTTASAPPPSQAQMAAAPMPEPPMPMSLGSSDENGSPGAAELPYWQLRDRVLAQGLGALPAAPTSGGPAASPPPFGSPDGLDSLPAWQRMSLEKGVGL